MKHLLLAGGLLLAAPAPAQPTTPARPPLTAAELKRNFARMAESTEGAALAKLERATVRGLVAYLKANDVSAAQASYLGLDYLAAGDAAHFKVFTYSYSSGGSRGTVSKPVMQWRNAAGQRFAYAVQQAWGFDKLYKLASPGRTQYLLLGSQRADGHCEGSQADVVELTGNYLLLDKPAFGAYAFLQLCNVELTFDPGPQVLRLDLSEDSELTAYSGEALAQLGLRAQPRPKRLTLRFRNGRFVKGR